MYLCIQIVLIRIQKYGNRKNTSDNILILTACVAGMLCKGTAKVQERFLQFIVKNKHHKTYASQCLIKNMEKFAKKRVSHIDIWLVECYYERQN